MGNKLHHVCGPPGCGKTSYLSDQISKAAEKYDPGLILVASFTKSAVAELNRKQLPIPDENVGTLHSICYRALDHPEIVEQPKYLKEFSEAYPRYAMGSGTRDGVDDGYATGCSGDGEELLMEYSRLRALQRDRALWPGSVTNFSVVWEKFKQETGTLDFTDLIERALLDVDRPRCYPMVGFFDECQDFTPLEIALVRKWSATMEQSVLVYDTDQSIYGFKGADPTALYDPSITPIVLKQSYRVPRAVQAVSEKLISQVKNRYQREYLPRDYEGEVGTCNYTFKDAKGILDLAMKYVDEYKTVLLLATCSYMLTPLISHMRDQGVAFSNPYRRRRRDWNPLHRVKNQQSAATRVAAFCQAFSRTQVSWTVPELHLWLEMTRGVGRRKWKDYAGALPQDAVLTWADLSGIIEIEDIMAAERGKESWLVEKLNSTWRNTAGYALRVAARDELSLHQEPQIFIGSVHSVKGGEADAVILCPDLSPQGAAQWAGAGEGADAIRRQFFVGCTRARETLILCKNSGNLYMPPWF